MAREVLRWCRGTCGRSLRLDKDFPRNGIRFRYVCKDCYAAQQRQYRKRIATLVKEARALGLGQ